MSRRAAARRYESADLWLSNGLSRLNRMARESLSITAAIRTWLMPHGTFWEAARAEKSDITPEALCDRLSAERGSKPTPR